jgi:hypothetical protein
VPYQDMARGAPQSWCVKYAPRGCRYRISDQALSLVRDIFRTVSVVVGTANKKKGTLLKREIPLCPLHHGSCGADRSVGAANGDKAGAGQRTTWPPHLDAPGDAALAQGLAQRLARPVDNHWLSKAFSGKRVNVLAGHVRCGQIDGVNLPNRQFVRR